MHGRRDIEAFCETCGEVTGHLVTEDDPGSCACRVCGRVQVLMVPVD